MKQHLVEILHGNGHKNIQATHRSTLEFTKEINLTQKGDCIVVVNIDKGFNDLNQAFLDLCKSKKCRIKVILMCEGISDEICGNGHPDLSFQNPISMVIRKSHFVCPRTLMINANKAAKDLKRTLITKLNTPNSQIQIKLIAEI
ncbi:MAG TPA: DUF371 domain-containing protein [Candidatus Deferrimicrobium sp.]|nr:DUF371 domain-containing protein [Candidatus Deferrimicrobium sp.]